MSLIQAFEIALYLIRSVQMHCWFSFCISEAFRSQNLQDPILNPVSCIFQFSTCLSMLKTFILFVTVATA